MTGKALKLLSWNVNGARAVYKNGFLDWLAAADTDIICLQETRAEEHQLPEEMRQPAGYHAIWNPSRARKGYSGTAILTREAPLHVELYNGWRNLDTPNGRK